MVICFGLTVSTASFKLNQLPQVRIGFLRQELGNVTQVSTSLPDITADTSLVQRVLYLFTIVKVDLPEL